VTVLWRLLVNLSSVARSEARLIFLDITE